MTAITSSIKIADIYHTHSYSNQPNTNTCGTCRYQGCSGQKPRIGERQLLLVLDQIRLELYKSERADWVFGKYKVGCLQGRICKVFIYFIFF